ncbi:methyl-accepting chemotaxis protein [Marinospirillum sp.]|uniref:methyl-accepting chemotaxis protein n=1 Tax=Marinospirillum sp. TaxID=2183934 RepID=UPI003A8C0815
MLNQLSMMQRLLMAVLLPLLIGFLLLGLLVTSQLNQAVPPLIEEGSRRQVEARGAEVARWLDGYRMWMQALSSAHELRHAQTLEEIEGWLIEQHGGDTAVESFFFAQPNGQAMIHTGQRFDISGRDYFQELLVRGQQERVLTQPMLSVVTGNPVAVMAQVVRDPQGNKVGLLGISLSMEELSQIVASLEMGAGSYGWVVDGTGMMVAHPAPQARMQINVTDADRHGYQGLDQHGRRFVRGEAGMGDILNLNGESVTMVWNPIPNTPRWTVGVSVPSQNFTATTEALLWSIGVVIVSVLLALTVIIVLVARQQVRPIQRMVARMRDIAQGEADLTQQLHISRRDELGQLAEAFNQFIDRIRQLVSDIGGTAHELAGHAQRVESASLSMGTDMDNQQSEVDQIAAAMNQLVATVEEVARHAQDASIAAQQGGQETEQGSERVRTVVSSIQEQAEVIRSTATEVEKLQQSGEQIGQVMDVIRAIAEQTNLLALNAAIEAARAGEAGRGFAVVADEVRTLAARTHDSTEQIQATVDQLRQRITTAVDSMRASNARSDATTADAEAAGQALISITSGIQQIEGMNIQIASATEQQSSTVDELNRNLERIVELSGQTSHSAQDVAHSGTQLNQVAQELQQLVGRFKV